MSASHGTSINETQSKFELWAKTRQAISKEKNDWVTDKEFLNQSITLLEGEIDTLDSTIKQIEETNTAAGEERFSLLDKRGVYQASSEISEERITQLEKDTLGLIKKFPDVLVEKLERLIVRIPDDPSDSKLSLGQRLQNIVGILSQAEKFDKSATFAGETRELPNGTKIQARTLYWGLSVAFYVDMLGQRAGIGIPGEEGWVWTERNDIAADVKQFIDIYEGNTDIIEFVQLPVAFK